MHWRKQHADVDRASSGTWGPLAVTGNRSVAVEGPRQAAFPP